MWWWRIISRVEAGESMHASSTTDVIGTGASGFTLAQGGALSPHPPRPCHPSPASSMPPYRPASAPFGRDSQQLQSRISVDMAMLLRWNALAGFQGPGCLRHLRNLDTNIPTFSTLTIHCTSF